MQTLNVKGGTSERKKTHYEARQIYGRLDEETAKEQRSGKRKTKRVVCSGNWEDIS